MIVRNFTWVNILNFRISSLDSLLASFDNHKSFQENEKKNFLELNFSRPRIVALFIEHSNGQNFGNPENKTFFWNFFRKKPPANKSVRWFWKWLICLTAFMSNKQLVFEPHVIRSPRSDHACLSVYLQPTGTFLVPFGCDMFSSRVFRSLQNKESIFCASI